MLPPNQTPVKINFNATVRHHWLQENVCLHCGLKRKILRWKELVTSPEGKKDLIYRHKMIYFFTVPADALAKRPRCIGSGKLEESDYAEGGDKH